MKRMIVTAAAAGALLFCGAARAEVVDFEAGPGGTQAQGFSAVGHPDLQFFSANGGAFDLEVDNFGDQGDGNSLGVFGDTDGDYLIGQFSGTTTSVALDFGNDDPGFSNPGDLATLRTFLGGVFVGQSTVVLNRDDIMNQTISFSGGPFDKFTFAYTDASGSPFTGGGNASEGLTEIVDNITYGAVAGGAPEPAAWALMIGGFGLAGAALRRRRAAAATA